MVVDGPLAPVVALLATYALHSTAFVALAWLVEKMVRRLSTRGAQRLWRAALVGALVSAPLASFGWVEPFGGRIPLGVTAAAPVETTSRAPVVALEEWTVDVGAAWVAAQPIARETETARRPLDVAAWIVAVWALGAALGIARLARARRALRRLLEGRRSVAFGAAARSLERLRGGFRGNVRLSRSRELAVPIAFGLVKPEICLPERALAELAQPELDAVIAHELGHIARRDPAWLLAVHTACAVLWFQPFLRLVRARLAALAELEADAFAARRTHAPLALAGALTRVAAWWRPTRPALAAHAMAGAHAALTERVERLLDGRAAKDRARRREWSLPMASVAAIVAAAPAWRVDAAPATSASPEPAPMIVVEPATGTAHPSLAMLDALLAESIRDAALLDVRLATLPHRTEERAELAQLMGRLERVRLLRDELAAVTFHRADVGRAPHAADVPRSAVTPAPTSQP